MVAVCVLLGAGFGQGAQLGVVDPCGIGCPCEDAEAEAHARGAHDGHEADGDPCSEDCADDCPDCRCSVGVTVAFAPSAWGVWPALAQPLRGRARPESPLTGTRVGVFRPPRAHA